TAALLVGALTNKLLMPGFEPAINFNTIDKSIESANKLIFAAPEPLKYLCSAIIFIFFLKSVTPKIKSSFEKIYS
ncbi:MAG: permease, partial [Tissierellia bacterium]|nr:permease [Tissierellia bacterium]